jgi:hypothetical protein
MSCAGRPVPSATRDTIWGRLVSRVCASWQHALPFSTCKQHVTTSVGVEDDGVNRRLGRVELPEWCSSRSASVCQERIFRPFVLLGCCHRSLSVGGVGVKIGVRLLSASEASGKVAPIVVLDVLFAEDVRCQSRYLVAYPRRQTDAPQCS